MCVSAMFLFSLCCFCVGYSVCVRERGYAKPHCRTLAYFCSLRPPILLLHTQEKGTLCPRNVGAREKGHARYIPLALVYPNSLFYSDPKDLFSFRHPASPASLFLPIIYLSIPGHNFSFSLPSLSHLSTDLRPLFRKAKLSLFLFQHLSKPLEKIREKKDMIAQLVVSLCSIVLIPGHIMDG